MQTGESSGSGLPLLRDSEQTSDAGDKAPNGVLRRHIGLYVLFAATAVVLILLRQIGEMLGRLEANGTAASLSVLHNPQAHASAIGDAASTWGAAATRSQAAALIHWHLLADLAFIGLYATLLWLLVRRLTKNKNDRQGRSARWWPHLLLAVVVVADLIEDTLTLWFASRVHGGKHISELLEVALFLSTWTKWIALLGFGLTTCSASLPRLNGSSSTGDGGPPPGTRREQVARAVLRLDKEPRRVWRRHRVQVGTLLALGGMVALPLGGPLDQLPDVLRTVADGKHVRWGELVPSVLTLGLFCVALWVAGRWALLDGISKLRVRARSPLALLSVAGVTAVLAALLGSTRPGKLHFSRGLAALPLILLVVAALSVVAFKVPWQQESRRDPAQKPTGTTYEDVRRAGSFLACLPLAIAGLGFVRAFADPLLAGPTTATGEAFGYFGLGLAGVLLGAPLGYAVFTLLDGRLGKLPEPLGPRVLNVAGGVVGAVAVGLAAADAYLPIRMGAWLNVTGSLTVLLALIAIVGGYAQRRVEARMPLALVTQLRLPPRTPVFLLAVVVFLLAGLLNGPGGYHRVRLVAAGTAADGTPLDAQFNGWLRQAKGCSLPHATGESGRPVVPLVLVAAPGGGIRAAYWTAEALDGMTTQAPASSCDRSRVFAASGVSGGSLGLVEHFADSARPRRQQGDVVDRISKERPLAGDAAAMLFRDLPAGLLGMTGGWTDRAGVMEDAWGQDAAYLRDKHLLRDLRPGAEGDDWRPLLILNGTDVSTGCRLLVSPEPLAATGVSAGPKSCAGTTVAPGGTVPGAVNLTDWRDQQNCKATSEDVRASTAALLSARFPYVSPSGELFNCTGTRSRTADLDGGAAENTGLASLLDVWTSLEPIIARHNRGLGGPVDPAPTVEVEPLLLLLDNHYESTAIPKTSGRARELVAPLEVAGANGMLASGPVQEQRALAAFSGPLPGAAREAGVRFYRVGPQKRPGVAAPLGWTLSDLTRQELNGQLCRSMAPSGPQSGDLLVPQTLGDYLAVLRSTPEPCPMRR